MYKEAYFNFDLPVPGEGPFHGFYDPAVNWNGFACPKFDFEGARQVLKEVVEINQADFIPGAIWGYREKEDFFFIAYPASPDYPFNDNLWIMKGETIEINGAPIKVYDIGSYGWSWVPEEVPLK